MVKRSEDSNLTILAAPTACEDSNLTILAAPTACEDSVKKKRYVGLHTAFNKHIKF